LKRTVRRAVLRSSADGPEALPKTSQYCTELHCIVQCCTLQYCNPLYNALGARGESLHPSARPLCPPLAEGLSPHGTGAPALGLAGRRATRSAILPRLPCLPLPLLLLLLLTPSCSNPFTPNPKALPPPTSSASVPAPPTTNPRPNPPLRQCPSQHPCLPPQPFPNPMGPPLPLPPAHLRSPTALQAVGP